MPNLTDALKAFRDLLLKQAVSDFITRRCLVPGDKALLIELFKLREQVLAAAKNYDDTAFTAHLMESGFLTPPHDQRAERVAQWRTKVDAAERAPTVFEYETLLEELFPHKEG